MASAQERNPRRQWSRRQMIFGSGAVALTAGLSAYHRLAASSKLSYPFPSSPSQGARPIPPTPACSPGTSARTASLTEGPFYTPDTPERHVLVTPNMRGTRLTLTGSVLTTDCQPVPGAVLDFWQADARGVYDQEGFTLRGHFFTDAHGTYRLETIKPAFYGSGGFGRTPHLHVKVQGRETQLLTTQLFFPDEVKTNARDWGFRETLLIEMKETAGGALTGTFTFVLPRA